MKRRHGAFCWKRMARLRSWRLTSVNVTSAFSAMQDKLAALKRARITVLKSGIEKFV